MTLEIIDPDLGPLGEVHIIDRMMTEDIVVTRQGFNILKTLRGLRYMSEADVREFALKNNLVIKQIQ